MKLFVWDFHGVLEEGNEGAVVEVTNSVLEKFGYSARLTEEQCNSLYGRKWFEYFQHLLPDESLEKHLELQEACFSHQHVFSDIIPKHIRPNRYAHEVLSAIQDAGHTQLLISNTNNESIDYFIRCAGVERFFTDGNAIAVHAHDPDNRKSKADVLKEFLEGKVFDEIIIIGDSPSDIALREVCGGVTYLYTHPGRGFKECDADYRIHDLREILRHA